MNKFSIPTPEQVDYDNTQLFEQIIQTISNHLKERIFKIKVQDSWFPFEKKVKQIVKEYGWELKGGWSGSKDEGYSVWEFFPIK